MWEIMKHFKISSLSHPQVPSPESGASAPWMYTWRGPCQRDRSGWWISRRWGQVTVVRNRAKSLRLTFIKSGDSLYSSVEMRAWITCFSIQLPSFPGKLGRRGIDKQCRMLHESWISIEGNVLAERMKKERQDNRRHLQNYIRVEKISYLNDYENHSQ